MLSGSNLVGSRESRAGSVSFRARDPKGGAALEPEFAEATAGEVDAAAHAAEAAFDTYAALAPARRAAFLRQIGAELVALGDTLLDRVAAETALLRPRVESERARTVGQARMFADLVEEGSWVEARVDRAQPDRKPLPKPDVRRMLMPLGPVGVFGASNFPLAFSVAGGDSVSALAAGCPVVAKAHPAHPGTSELAARAILSAARATGMPEGVFSLVQGPSLEVGQALVAHPAIQAIAFTGSFRGGKALLEAGARRPQPIPVFAEMGAANPLFVLPDALATRGEEIAATLAASVTLDSGQFCTNPGLLFVAEPAEAFVSRLGALLAASPAGTMVHGGIKKAYDEALTLVGALAGVTIAARAAGHGDRAETEAQPALVVTDATSFGSQQRLGDEIFGPATVAVRCRSVAELMASAAALRGCLVVTVYASERDLAAHPALLPLLARKAGRIVLNGVPTGVEVTHAMHHGGPWPATSDARTTSVGTAAILRFARPVCFQDVPDAALPEELRDRNPRGIWRLLDGNLSRQPLPARS
jgi:alpha-ketoglutaric semialdehyde dehydrogenase